MISLEYINVQMMDLKSTKIKETVTSNEDGSYTIFLNSRFTQEEMNKWAELLDIDLKDYPAYFFA